MVFHWSFSDSKFPQVSRTLLSILAVINNVVVWMVSTRLPASNSFSHFNEPLVTVPNAPITIGIIVTFMFHSFFDSQARARYLSFFSHSFSFIMRSAGIAKATILQIIFFFFFSLTKNDNAYKDSAVRGIMVKALDLIICDIVLYEDRIS